MRIAVRILIATACVAVLGLAPMPADADPASCQSTYVKQLLRLKKKLVQLQNRCVDRQNVGTVAGPCPDLVTAAKLADVEATIRDKIAGECTLADASALGFPGDCNLGAVSDGAQGACAALPVTSATEFAECLICWKEAELSRYVATLYASHAEELCGGDLGSGSTVCSSLGCTEPLPNQRDLGDTGEADCQRAIGKGGFKYLLLREKFLEKCALRGFDRATCLADPDLLLKLAKVNQKKNALIQRKCGNRDPEPNPPFCCRTGMGNACSIASTPDECELLGGDVQEGKFCDAGSCAPVGGNKGVTWWGFCPQSSTCPGTALADLDDLKACVAATGDDVVDELLCLQFPGNGGADWPCPAGPGGSPSGAFLDGPSFF